MMRYLIALLLLCVPAFAADTGWVIASAGSNQSNSSTDWINTDRVTADDASYATCAPSGLADTDWLRATFTLTIPVGATIDGIEVRYQVHRSATGPDESDVYLVVGGSQVGVSRGTGVSYTGTPTDYTRGGATDKWGLTPTRDQCVGANFGFQFFSTDSDSGSDTVSCDAMWIKVYYTEAAPPASNDPGFLFNFLEE